MDDFNKCNSCESHDLEKYNITETEYVYDEEENAKIPAEYSVRCKYCGKYVGHFSYGHWEY